MKSEEMEKCLDNVFEKHPGLKWSAMCFYRTFDGDTIIEKFECLFMKFVEMENLLKTQGGENFTIEAGKFIAEWIQCTCVNVFKENDKDSENYIGTLSNRWKVYKNGDLNEDEALIKSSVGSALLKVLVD